MRRGAPSSRALSATMRMAMAAPSLPDAIDRCSGERSSAKPYRSFGPE
jgi:hypothetical protein